MGKYDFDEMAAKMSPFITHQDSFCTAVKDADGSVDDNIQTSNGAIRGILGSKLKKEWDDNCSILLNFDAYFDNLTKRAVDVYNNNSEGVDDVSGGLTQTNNDSSTTAAAAANASALSGIADQGGEV